MGSKIGLRCAVLLAEEGHTCMVRARNTTSVTVRRFPLPCTCRPALADLPGALRALTATVRPDWLFIEVPALAASGLLGEFDRALSWQREVVVCLDRAWASALQEQSLSPFHLALLELADHVVASQMPGGAHQALMLTGTAAPNPEACSP
jgi:hypothetical protein